MKNIHQCIKLLNAPVMSIYLNPSISACVHKLFTVAVSVLQTTNITSCTNFQNTMKDSMCMCVCACVCVCVCVCMHVSMLSFEGGVITKMKPLHLYFHTSRQHFVKAAPKCSNHHRFYARQMNSIHMTCKSLVPLCNKTQTGITPASPSTNSWHQSLVYSAFRERHTEAMSTACLSI